MNFPSSVVVSLFLPLVCSPSFGCCVGRNSRSALLSSTAFLLSFLPHCEPECVRHDQRATTLPPLTRLPRLHPYPSYPVARHAAESPARGRGTARGLHTHRSAATGRTGLGAATPGAGGRAWPVPSRARPHTNLCSPRLPLYCLLSVCGAVTIRADDGAVATPEVAASFTEEQQTQLASKQESFEVRRQTDTGAGEPLGLPCIRMRMIELDREVQFDHELRARTRAMISDRDALRCSLRSFVPPCVPVVFSSKPRFTA